MRNYLFILAAMLAADHSQAQFTFLTDNRSVAVSGYAAAEFASLDQGGNISMTWQTNDYSDFQSPASVFSDFYGSVSNGAYIFSANPLMNSYASSSASQDSNMTLDQIGLSSSISVTSMGGGGSCLAETLSSFAISFSVSSPTPINLSVNWSYSTGGDYWVPGNGGCNFSSANDGLIWQSRLINVDPSNVYAGSRLDTYSAMLEPGNIYTLVVSMNAASSYADTPPTYADYSANVMLATSSITFVPEPSPWLLSTLGLMGLAFLKNRGTTRKAF